MLTIDELREHITTTLGDDALQLLLNAAYEAIDHVAGSDGSEDYPASITELITVGPGDLFMLSRPAEGITSVTEYRDTTPLADDDYELVGNQLVRRLGDGTNPGTYWRRRVTVTYTPLGLSAERDRVAIALVELDATSSPGVASERLGDHSITFSASSEYAAERAAILASYNPGFIAA